MIPLLPLRLSPSFFPLPLFSPVLLPPPAASYHVRLLCLLLHHLLPPPPPSPSSPPPHLQHISVDTAPIAAGGSGKAGSGSVYGFDCVQVIPYSFFLISSSLFRSSFVLITHSLFLIPPSSFLLPSSQVLQPTLFLKNGQALTAQFAHAQLQMTNYDQ